jgi:ankyrin repeat protein
MVRLLLSHGAFVDSRDQLGGTALHLAAATGEDVAVAALLDGGADIEAIHAEGGTALHFAAAKGNLSTVMLLLDKEANVHALDDGGQTPADVASRERIKAVLRDWASGAGRNRRGGVSGVPDKPLDDQPRKIQAEGPGPTIVLASRGPETQQR